VQDKYDCRDQLTRPSGFNLGHA